MFDNQTASGACLVVITSVGASRLICSGVSVRSALVDPSGLTNSTSYAMRGFEYTSTIVPKS
jgi:hypothetical protein